MADTEGARSLRLWALATFHTVSFVAALVVAVHSRGALSSALGRLDTVTGFGFFLLLWAITWFTTRLGLRNMGTPVDDAPSAMIVFSTTVAGGWNGVGIFFIIILVSLMSVLVSGPRTLVPVLFFASILGSLLAFTVGAVVGLVYGLFDALLLRISAILFARGRGWS